MSLRGATPWLGVKTLILKPSSLGDVVHALPVLRLLKRHNPDNQVYWWISAELKPLLDHDPDLSGLFLFHRHGWARPHYWVEFLRTIRQLRSCRFDWAIDLQGLARSSLISWLAQPRLNVGVEDWREGAPGLYDVVVPRPSFETHAIDWYLETLKVLQVPVHWDFVWMPASPQTLQAFRSKWKVGSGRWIALNPGARWNNKRWPGPHFAEVVRRLARAHPELQFVILGASGDRALGKLIARAAPSRCLDLTGKTSLPELVEWIRASDLLLSNDTGPMHIADALGKPVVSVFGPTEPRRTGPYYQRDGVVRIDLPCAPCLKPHCSLRPPLQCLLAITPEMVCAKIEERLALNNRPQRCVD